MLTFDLLTWSATLYEIYQPKLITEVGNAGMTKFFKLTPQPLSYMQHCKSNPVKLLIILLLVQYCYGENLWKIMNPHLC